MLDVYESAAYLRVSPDLMRGLLTLTRGGKPILSRFWLGGRYRIRREDLDWVGRIESRATATAQ